MKKDDFIGQKIIEIKELDNTKEYDDWFELNNSTDEIQKMMEQKTAWKNHNFIRKQKDQLRQRSVKRRREEGERVMIRELIRSEKLRTIQKWRQKVIDSGFYKSLPEYYLTECAKKRAGVAGLANVELIVILITCWLLFIGEIFRQDW